MRPSIFYVVNHHSNEEKAQTAMIESHKTHLKMALRIRLCSALNDGIILNKLKKFCIMKLTLHCPDEYMFRFNQIFYSHPTF